MVLLSAFSLMTSLQWQPGDWSSGQVLLPVGSSSQARLAKLTAPISRFIGAAPYHGIPVTYHDFINQNQPPIPKILHFQTWKREPSHHMSPVMLMKFAVQIPKSCFCWESPIQNALGSPTEWRAMDDNRPGTKLSDSTPRRLRPDLPWKNHRFFKVEHIESGKNVVLYCDKHI